MAFPHVRGRRGLVFLSAAAALLILFPSAAAHGPSCPFSSAAKPHDHHHDNHHHHHHHHHHYRHDHDHHRHGEVRKLPEELAEEEDLALFGFDHGNHDHDHNHEASALGVWLPAMGCSLLVSMASLVCLIIVPVFFLRGKPSKLVVDSLAVFGAGAMLGDAFLHQLPHAFGGEHSHSHDHSVNGLHEDHAEHGHSHAHSLKDLSVGLSVLSGIVLFLLVEKVVRYVEDSSGNGAHTSIHGHHHHKKHHKLKDNDNRNNSDINNDDSMGKDAQDILSEEKSLDGESNRSINGGHAGQETLRKRGTSSGTTAADGIHSGAENSPVENKQSFSEPAKSSPSSLVFGYLNLFSDGVHNFTDGMALGSAFLLYGPVGGWSRTMFLLAHELPQEIGDFGILVRSGFTVSKALFFNFLSALVALAGTALALVLGKDPGHSSLIEGFTAGGFIYIAVAGVFPEMNSGRTTFKSTSLQLTSLILGVAVALFISLVE